MVKADVLYCWFKLHQKELSDVAKWDFLNFIRDEVDLDLSHREWFMRYGLNHDLIGLLR